MAKELKRENYYWVIDQAEYATDVMFRESAGLSGLYKRMVEHARVSVSAEDVLKFLGRKPSGNFKGELQTHVSRRVEGVRVVHRMKGNKLKMYDKGGIVLRIETTINNPGEFRVRRQKAGRKGLRWQPLLKGVGWMWRYADVCGAANRRYLEAMAVVDDDSKARQLLDRVNPTGQTGRSTQASVTAVKPGGPGIVPGGDAWRAPFAWIPQWGYCGAADTRRRRTTPRSGGARCGRVTRLIQVLRAHGLVAKIPRTLRYRITANGELLMSAAIKTKEVPHHHYLRLTSVRGDTRYPIAGSGHDVDPYIISKNTTLSVHLNGFT